LLPLFCSVGNRQAKSAGKPGALQTLRAILSPLPCVSFSVSHADAFFASTTSKIRVASLIGYRVFRFSHGPYRLHFASNLNFLQRQFAETPLAFT
jgi:hypothetical protein